MWYLDNNATTSVAPEVLEAMLPFLTERWGNPSSVYRFGQEISQAIDTAREQVANLIGATKSGVIFTSGATESNNTAVRSALAAQKVKRHLVTSKVEHSSIMGLARQLENEGFEITFVGVDGSGQLDIAELEAALRPDTALVSLIWANNETGVLFPIERVGALCRERDIPFHTDAVQALGKIPCRVQDLPVDFLSLSAHKFHAPKGIGALYVRPNTPFVPLIIGGQQEARRRGGTENVPHIVGMGYAAELAVERLSEMAPRVGRLRDRLEEELIAKLPQTRCNGYRAKRLPNTSNLSFSGADGEALALALDAKGVCVSTGSACTSGSVEPSHVLKAMGVTAREARSAIRFSLGHQTTEEDVDRVLPLIISTVEAVRQATP